MTPLVRRTLAVFFGAATIAAGAACRRTEPASVQEVYSTRMLGLGYLRRNQLAEAEAEFRKLTTLAPDDAAGYADLGLTYLQAGRYQDAEKQLRRARELDPASTEIGLALARLYALTGRSPDARALLERLRRDTTQSAQVLYALAELEAQQPGGASAGAYRDRLREVLAVAPANLVARLKLTLAFARIGEADSAVRHLEDVRRIPPALPLEARTYLDSTIQLLRGGNLERSRTALDRLLALVEVTAPYQAALADVQWTEGPIAGRAVLTFVPRNFISLNGGRARATVDLARFVDATDDAGLATAGGPLGAATAPGRQAAPHAIAAGDVSWPTSAEKTRHSRIRRAMSWLYCAP